MPRSTTLGVTLLVVLGTAQPPSAQTRPGAAEPQSLAAAATAILVDVVVRDRRGRPVADLTAADFEVAEDGVRQQVDTFSRVSRGGGIGVGVAWKASTTTVSVAAAEGAGAEDATVEREPTVTALVFDHLSPESLRLAQRATLDYLPATADAEGRVGVFATGPGIRVLLPFSTDRLRIRQAVQQIAPAGSFGTEWRAERAEELTDRRRRLQEPGDESGGGGSGGADLSARAARIGPRETEKRLLQTELNMIRSFDHMDREHRGYDTSRVLMTVIQSLAEYPGRKTIVFFSEGLPASPVLSARLDNLIDAANRANVTAYAVDAHGLHARSAVQTMRKEVEEFAHERMVQNATGVQRTEQPLTMAFERVEDTLRLDSRSGLARFARDTGGFLVEGSNDLSSAFRRIGEDQQFHYLLTYSPANTDFDGRFRAIQVKVRRPGVQVFARRGYRATRSTAPDFDGYQTPALALLDRTPLPKAFQTYAAAYSFPEPARPGLVPLLVQVKTSALSFTLDTERSAYAAQAAIVVRIRDGHGSVVHTLGQEYLFTGDSRDVDAARTGEILFYREVDLGPGVYTVESIVYDARTGGASGRIGTLTVPGPDEGRFGVSSLVLVSRAETLDAAADPPAGPLYVGHMLLYPNLGEPIRRTPGSELPFYFRLWGDVPRAGATAELLRNGQQIAGAPIELQPASAGLAPQVGRLPIGALDPGTYELRIRLRDGDRELARSVFFTLRD